MIYLRNIEDSMDKKQDSDFLFFLQNNLLTNKGQIIIIDKVRKFGFFIENEFVSKLKYDIQKFLIIMLLIRVFLVFLIPKDELMYIQYTTSQERNTKDDKKRGCRKGMSRDM